MRHHYPVRSDYTAYQFWELPNHGAMDKIRSSESMVKMVEASYEFTESRPTKSAVPRKPRTKIMLEPKKQMLPSDPHGKTLT